MGLAGRRLREVTVDEVYSAWLAAERRSHEEAVECGRYQAPGLSKMEFLGIVRRAIDSPKLKDAAENALRRELLFAKHGRTAGGIPPGTAWYEYGPLRSTDLEHLRAIRASGWRSVEAPTGRLD